MTIPELYAMAEVSRERDRENIRLAAQAAVWVANYSGMRSKPISVEDILRFSDEPEPEKKIDDETKKVIKHLVDEFKKPDVNVDESERFPDALTLNPAAAAFAAQSIPEE